MFYSVIIPIYNGSHFIAPLCASLSGQEDPGADYEIIIIDNGSTDDSLAILKSESESMSHLRIFTFTEQQSSYAARNYGVMHSLGDVLVFTDVDCRPQPDWLLRLGQACHGYKADFLIAGSIKIYSAGEDFNYYEWFDYCSFLKQELYSREKSGATANLAVTRRAYDRVAGFAPIVSGGDKDFCRRVMALGDVTFKYQPAACILHPARSSAGEIRKKLYRLGQGHALANFRNRSAASRLAYLGKQLLYLFIQPNNLRIIRETFRKKGIFNFWSLGFAFVTLKLGFYSRRTLLVNYLSLIFTHNPSSCRSKKF